MGRFLVLSDENESLKSCSEQLKVNFYFRLKMKISRTRMLMENQQKVLYFAQLETQLNLFLLPQMEGLLRYLGWEGRGVMLRSASYDIVEEWLI